MFIGAHLPISKGFKAAVQTANELGANTFQYFTRNPRGSKARALDERDIEESKHLMKEQGFGTLVAHAPYTINLAAPSPETWEFAVQTLREDLIRAEKVGAMLAVHPGSHGGKGLNNGLGRTIDGLNQVLLGSGQAILLLEGMSGQGSEVGSTFEELKYLMQGVKQNKRLGVILDTCHLYAAGYDIKDDLEGVLRSFDKAIGLKHLHALHVNDSRLPLGSHRDRHANLGEGTLGFDFFAGLVKNHHIKNLPLILETPGGLSNYKAEIDFLRKNA